VGWIADSSWMDYHVSPATAGYYTFKLRIANGFSPDASVSIKSANGTKLAQIILPTTGGMQSWETVSMVAFLPAGNQTLRIFAEKGLFSFNWFECAAGKALPGKIEAEDFSIASDVRKEMTEDTDGGHNVSHIDDGDWMDYNVEVQHAGAHIFNFRIANSYGNGVIEIKNAEGTTLGQVSVPITGGWQSFSTISTTAVLPAGNQIIRIRAAQGGFNFNWFETSLQTAGNENEVPVPRFELPGKIEAEHYYAMHHVTTEATSDIGGGLNASWINDGSWMDYNVHLASAGYYTFKFRIANGYSPLAKLSLRDSSGIVLGETILPQTGGIQSWETVNIIAFLSAGNKTLRIHADKGDFNFNWFEGVAAKALPGKIQAEDFDLSSDVRKEATEDTDGGLHVSYIDDGDWLDYNVNVAEPGIHTFDFRVANSYGNGIIQIRNNEGTVLGQISVPRTGGWQNFTTIRTTAILPAGNQILRFYALSGAFNFNWLDVTQGGTAATPVQSVISFDEIPVKTMGDAPFDLIASSNNTESPVTFSSSDDSVISVSNVSGTWKATILKVGSAAITASQTANVSFLTAENVTRSVTVQAAPDSSSAQKIAIDSKRWYQLSNVSNGLDALFDGDTQTNLFTGWGKVIQQYDAYYPLLDGEEITLESIKLFDFQGSDLENPATISVINENWERTQIASFNGQLYNTWVGPYPDRNLSGDAQFKLDVPVGNIRYLVINMGGIMPTEIEFYGTHTPATQTPSPVPVKNVKLGDMFGVNGYEWNFQHGAMPWQNNEAMFNVAKSFTGVRHYIDWDKLESQEGVYSFNPTLNGGWHYDLIYERCKQENIDILACLKSKPEWMQNTYPVGQRDSENIPVKYGKAFDDPNSYIEQAKLAFQFAARYGRNTNVDSSLLSVHTTPRWPGDNPNTVKIGLDLIKYIECDNERDKWWKGRQGYADAREYAANLSAFYDGNKNTMGPGAGVKNADSTMLVVIGGLVSGPEYVRAMVDWCKQYRGYNADGTVNLCWDVVNFHLYTDNTSSSQSGTSTRGSAPELTPANKTVEEFVKVTHEMCYDMPVWITETGFDVHQDSPLKAIPVGNKSVLQTQADWILRTSLFSARLGIDKVFFYQMYDDNEGGAMFSSSGLLNLDQTRRPAADYLFQVNKVFGNYLYKETIHSDPIVDRYEFNGKSVYILTVPDDIGRTASYTVNLGGTGMAQIYRPAAGSDNMTLEEVPIVNGQVTVTASETPMFVTAAPVSNARMAQTAVMPVPEVAETQPLHHAIEVYPNPTIDFITINMANDSNADVEIKIFDASIGRLYKQERIQKTGASVVKNISMQSLPTGVYIVEVKQGNERAFRKVVKAN
jgi:endoglucanase